uniref:Uncharacterized protein n=1 Tax=Cacopsylla melanoneura TaxID=428564 RepID=A0A8D8Q315_9HEMI
MQGVSDLKQFSEAEAKVRCYTVFRSQSKKIPLKFSFFLRSLFIFSHSIGTANTYLHLSKIQVNRPLETLSCLRGLHYPIFHSSVDCSFIFCFCLLSVLPDKKKSLYFL